MCDRVCVWQDVLYLWKEGVVDSCSCNMNTHQILKGRVNMGRSHLLATEDKALETTGLQKKQEAGNGLLIRRKRQTIVHTNPA